MAAPDPVPDLVLTVVRPDAAPARGALRRYAEEIVPGNVGRAATEDELTAFLASDPRSLVAPAGVLVLAWDGPTVVGCAGLRFGGADLPPGAGEVKRMWTDPAARGRRVAARLLGHLGELAREAGLRRLVLDTRADLTAARRLYEREGFVETGDYNANPVAEVWYAKDLW